jgi:type II secretory pathway component PulF
MQPEHSDSRNKKLSRYTQVVFVVSTVVAAVVVLLLVVVVMLVVFTAV